MIKKKFDIINELLGKLNNAFVYSFTNFYLPLLFALKLAICVICDPVCNIYTQSKNPEGIIFYFISISIFIYLFIFL